MFVGAGCADDSPSQKQVMTSPAVQEAGTVAAGHDAAPYEAGPSPTSSSELGPKGAAPDATTQTVTDGEPTPRDTDAGTQQPSMADSATPMEADANTAEHAAPADACSGKAGAKRGKSTQTVSVRGGNRSFIYYAPKDLDPNRPVPLVIVPHGYTQSGEEMFQITKYPAVADREGFVAVFPDGAPFSTGPWDVGSGVCGNGAFVPGSGDDQAFVDAMIAFASADQCIDKNHIFMTGWSMGGYLSHHSGCLRDDIRAIGPHSGGTHDLSGCKGKKKPVIIFHFDPDGLIDYSCGTKARDAWIARNGCQRDQPMVTMVQGGKCEHYRGCPADAQVALCTFQIPSNHKGDFLAGHAWSGGTVHSYSIAETESAAELGWKFFRTYAW
jgi:polyhydroxybutyrate depolymerase